MELVWLVALILASGAAVTGGHGPKGKLINLAIILGCMVLGFSLGYAAGLGRENMGQVRDAEWPFSLMLGIVASMGCMKLNMGR